MDAKSSHDVLSKGLGGFPNRLQQRCPVGDLGGLYRASWGYHSVGVSSSDGRGRSHEGGAGQDEWRFRIGAGASGHEHHPVKLRSRSGAEQIRHDTSGPPSAATDNLLESSVDEVLAVSRAPLSSRLGSGEPHRAKSSRDRLRDEIEQSSDAATSLQEDDSVGLVLLELLRKETTCES